MSEFSAFSPSLPGPRGADAHWLHRAAISRPASAASGAAALLGCAAALLGCGSSDEINVVPMAGAPATNPAVMLAGQVYSPEEYNTYVGIFDDVPAGDVDFAGFREFGNANAYTSAGHVFVEQDGIMQRFSVNERLELVDGPRFSWQEFGIASINTTSTVFVSAERAYTFAPELGLIIIWNPDTMERTGTLPVDLADRPAGMETFAYDGQLVGDRVFWNVFSGNWDTIVPYPAVTLVIADATLDDSPVRIIEDDRCIPGGPARVDDAGNYHVHGGGYYGYFLTYGGGPDARACVLRVSAGRAEFDADYLLDYEALTGSYVSEPWFHVSGNQYVTRSWDPALPIPENPDDFWDNAALRPLLIDTDAGTAAAYPDLAGSKTVDGTTRQVDGISYYQLSQTGYVENGNTDVVELHPEGIATKFHLNGFLLGLERVR